MKRNHYSRFISTISYSVSALDDEEQEEQGLDDLDETDDLGHQGDDPDLDLSNVTRSEVKSQPMYVLPLYSLLSTDRQAKVCPFLYRSYHFF